MRFLVVLGALVLGGAASAQAQHPHSGEVALAYQWVHSNTQPGQCGCFGLNGAGVSAALHVTPRLAAVVEVNAGHQGDGPGTGDSLTLVGYTGGVRAYLRPYRRISGHHLEPFGQVLAGTAHAGGGIAGAGDGTYSLALRAGGGVDVPLTTSLAIRAVQAEYYLTSFSNTENDHQNNFLVGAGVVYRF